MRVFEKLRQLDRLVDGIRELRAVHGEPRWDIAMSCRGLQLNALIGSARHVSDQATAAQMAADGAYQ